MNNPDRFLPRHELQITNTSYLDEVPDVEGVTYGRVACSNQLHVQIPRYRK
jgi:hypothetical protein